MKGIYRVNKIESDQNIQSAGKNQLIDRGSLVDPLQLFPFSFPSRLLIRCAIDAEMIPLCGACIMLAIFCANEYTANLARASVNTAPITSESKTNEMVNMSDPT